MSAQTASTVESHTPQTGPLLPNGHSVVVEGIDLMQVATLLLRRKQTLVLFMLATMIPTALLVSLVMKPVYTAEAIFLPPQSSPGSASSQLSSQLGSFGAFGALGGLKNPGDIYIGILSSRTIADGLIKQFNLQQVYKQKKLSDTETTLRKQSKFTADKGGLITISVTDHDPQRAADMANAFLVSLYQQNGRLALTESAQRTAFFARQLEREKDALADAEVELKKTQEKTGLIAPSGQAMVAIESIAQLQAQIMSRHVELSALKQGATDSNPDVIRLQTEISGLEQNLQQLENSSSQRRPGSIQAPTAKVPEISLEYVRKQREVKYHETLFDLLARQYEASKLDESRESPLLQVVDQAIRPDRKSGPPRSLLLIASAIIGLILGTAWVIVKAFWEKLVDDPAKFAQVAALRDAAWSTKP